MNLSQERKVVVEVAQESGEFLLEKFRENSLPEISIKGSHEILTQSDLKAEEIILKRIQKNFPSHQIWSEEAGRDKKDSSSLWIVDPLDGTTNFSIKNPLFAVSIGLQREGGIVLGVVYVPVTQEMFVAEKGKGAFLNENRLSVSSKKRMDESLLMFCHGAEEEDFRKIVEIYGTFKLLSRHFRQLGSASLELAYVAAGRAEAYMTHGGYPWDLVAGALLVEEAGGGLSDFEGKPWNWKSKTLLASNNMVHQEILEALKNVGGRL